MICLASPVGKSLATNALDAPSDYSRLLEYITMDDLQSPLVLIEDRQGDFDKDRNQENIAYLNGNPELLKRMQSRLHGEHIQWKLSNSYKRLLAVPEERQEYARLFEGYCKEAVAYVLGRIDFPNPYAAIATLSGPLPAAGDSAPEGLTAYLVHNIADEYVEEYLFFNEAEDNTKIKIQMSNRVFSGIIGSYSSQLVIGAENHFEFVREPYTFWQNSALNPLNVLIAPVEETLHVVLRQYTETAISGQLEQIKPQKLDQVKQVVNDWMAVEEAIVGGLVSKLMPEVLTRFVSKSSQELMAKAMADRDAHPQYRYLDRGIHIVADMGLQDALACTEMNPPVFANSSISWKPPLSSHSAVFPGSHSN